MLLDELTASLDFRNQSLVLATLRRLRAELGLTIVFTSHEPSHAQHLADRVLLMGTSAIKDGCAAELLTESNLSQLYGVAVRTAQLHIDGVPVRRLFADL